MPDWHDWHDRYDDPRAPLARRLAHVQGLIGGWLDATAPVPVAVVSVCAGDGRDILELLATRDDRSRVRTTLLELDARLCERARELVARHLLANVQIRKGDAGTTDAFAGAVPADLVLLVGMLGNISDDDIYSTIAMLPAICARDALVVWTRRRERGLVDKIGAWFEAHGFVETHRSGDEPVFHVGAHRFEGTPRSLPAGRRLFAFNV